MHRESELEAPVWVRPHPRLEAKDVHSSGVWFFGRPPTGEGNRRMMGLRSEKEGSLFVTRLDLHYLADANGIARPPNVFHTLDTTRRRTVIHRPMTFDECRKLLWGGHYMTGPGGWEARVISKASRVSDVVIFGEYGGT